MRLRQIAGVRLGTAKAGIKKRAARDIAIIAFDRPVATAATFTKNQFVAAPVTIARDNLSVCRGRTRAWLVNSGNANCGTGKAGVATAQKSCATVAKLLGSTPEQVLPFSTGVIMEQLPSGKLLDGAKKAACNLSSNGWEDAAKAIMTTDTRPKGASVSFPAKGKRHNITGIAKGSGMIHPDMATMLAFIATDAKIPATALRRHLSDAVSCSFNAISVDGDTSTNDSVAIAATGSGATLSKAEQKKFGGALKELCSLLAAQIVKDGEGATCTALVTVSGLRSKEHCKIVATSVACSPLVKTMLHARDPNLGRLLMAVGKAAVPINPKDIEIRINGLVAYRNEKRHGKFSEKVALGCFRKPQVKIEVRLGNRKTSHSILFSDLSKEYVRINSEYRS